MVQHTVQLNSSGGIPELEIRFGNANIGVCRIFRWGTNQQPMEVASLSLENVSISYEAIIQSPRSGPGQPYSLFISIRQDGETAPGGAIEEVGKLNPDGAKSVIGFITFQLS